jgi:hypothetical protein
MSKALSRLRALVSEIDAIQTEGRKSVSVSAPIPSPVVHSPAVEEPNNVLSMNAKAPETPPSTVDQSPEGKVFLQLSGKIAVQLQMEHSDEIVEVRQQGEMIEIRFNDGKAIHLPLKSVA